MFGSPAYQAGLRSFDTVKSLNGKKLRYARELEAEIQKRKFPLKFAAQREGAPLLRGVLEAPAGKAGPVSLKSLGIESPQLYIDKIGPGSPAEKAGLQKGDRLLSIDGKSLKGWSDVIDKISLVSGAAAPENRGRASLDKKASGTSALVFKYRRRGAEKTALISPKVMFVEGNLKKRLMVGIGSAENMAFPPEALRKRSVLGSFAYAGERTWHWLGVITIGLVRLAQGRMSVRTLGGPVTIGRIAHKSFQAGFYSFLFMMALISINLFFLNLLPIPLLDGGHILFFSLEGLMGRPLDLKKLVLAQQAGLFFVIFFFGWTFFNDIRNWIGAW